MKSTKLMLSAFFAAVALVACTKENTTPEGGNLKSVKLSIENVSYQTKGAGYATDLDGKDVVLNDIQIFFTDGSNIYLPKTIDGSVAKTAFTAEELAAADLNFHYLPTSVDEVYAIGNAAAVSVQDNDPLSKLHATLSIAGQQNPENLTLFAVSELRPLAAPAGDHSTHVSSTKVYSATLQLAPRVARFEIEKISCDFSAEPLFNSVEAVKLAFADYYMNSDLFTGTVSNAYNINTVSQETIFSYLTNMTPDWNCDVWSNSAVLTPSAESVEVNLAYNFFAPMVSGGSYPRFVMQVVTDNSEIAYVMTVKFRKSSDNSELAVTDFEPGCIYRIKDFRFADTDLTHQERCVEITVDVIEWSVVNVYPTF